MDQVQKAYIKIHIAVMLFGLTAIMGGLITLNALVLVWWRMLITVLSLLVLIDFKRIKHQIDRKLMFWLILNGFIIAIHWLCFYGSIKLANASVALVCMAFGSLFVAFFEPIILKRKFSRIEISLGLLTIPAMVLIVNQLEINMIMGVFVGIAAAALSALFGTLNKIFVYKAHSYDITFLELGGGWLLLSIILPFVMNTGDMIFWPSAQDWIYLVILAILCTTVAFILALQSLSHLSAFNSTLIVNLEPVYGILLAWLILNENEQLTTTFYIGVAIILLIVFLFPILKRKFKD
jgi:drug/metabolite transporter (DMT)-like permease